MEWPLRRAGSDWGWNNWSCNWYQGVANYPNYPYFGNHAWQWRLLRWFVYYGKPSYHDDATAVRFTSRGHKPTAPAPRMPQHISTQRCRDPKPGFQVFQRLVSRGEAGPAAMVLSVGDRLTQQA